MTTHVLMCRGNGEKFGEGMLMSTPEIKGLRDYLDDRFHIHEVPWDATYGPSTGDFFGSSYATDLQMGIIIIRDMLAELPEEDTAILCGYSAGATLAGNYAQLAVQNRTQMLGEKIAGVGLVADPMRPYGGGTVEFTPSGFGIGGQRDISSADFPVFWVADPFDPITSLPDNSPLRTIADQTYALSFGPGEFPQWIGDLADRLKTGRWQRVCVQWWNPIGVAQQYADAARALGRYLYGGDHTSYGIRNVPGLEVNYLEHLANKLNEAVKL